MEKVKVLLQLRFRPFLLLLLLFLLLGLLPLPGSCIDLHHDYEYYYDHEPDYYYESVEGDGAPPSFLARPQSFTVEVGQSVIIPCDSQDQGNHKLIIKRISEQAFGWVGGGGGGDGEGGGGRLTRDGVRKEGRRGGRVVGRRRDIPTLGGGREKLLSVGSEKVSRDRRISIHSSRLTISHARPRDAGTYYCLFDLDPPVQLKHTLDVQYAPTIRAMAAPEQQVTQGSTVKLQCRAHGNPEPTIRWFRQEGPLPSVLRSETGPVLEMVGMQRAWEGTYLCTADNGVGEPASAAMTVSVNYPPEVSTMQTVVRTGDGDHVELVCVVRGRPVPDVVWTRDGHPLPDALMDTHLHLPPTHPHLPPTTHGRTSGPVQHNHHNHVLDQGGNSVHMPSQDRGLASVDEGWSGGDGEDRSSSQHVTVTHLAHRHTLTIHNVTEKDFGAYVCIAENTLGQRDAVIQMTGLPQPPQVTSSPQGGEGRTYTLTWTTKSYYPVTEFLVRHRRTHLGWQPNRTMVMAGSWESVSQPVLSQPQTNDGKHNDNNDADEGGTRRQKRTHHALSYTLQGLEEATDYVAVVRVRNRYGWSSESDHFNFATKKAMAVLQSTSGASFMASASSVFQLLPLSLLLPLSFLTLVLLSSPSLFLV